jgi:F-type H+-transporting ATPase subunit epsilon
MSQDGKFLLEIVTPTRHLVSEGVEEVTAPGVEGEFGVLVGHTPYLTELGVGVLMYREDSQMKYVAVRKGFAEVTREKVTILAEEAEFPADIDLNTAEKSREEATKEIDTLSVESKEYLEAQVKLERAINQIHAVKSHGG